MRSSEEFDEIGRNEYHIRGYDYRHVASNFSRRGPYVEIYKQTRAILETEGVGTPERLQRDDL
jgi:hypothetical protein